MKRPIIPLILCLLFASLLFSCRHPVTNPLDPKSEDYAGFVSLDNDGDGIGQWEDVDEVSLMSPGDGSSVNTKSLVLIVSKFNPKKIQKYWIQLSTSTISFDGSIVFSKEDYSSNECTVPADLLVHNAHYYWRAKAYDGSKWSDNWSEIWSFTVSLPVPNTPSGLTAIAVSGTQIDLNWTDNSGDEDGFKIESKSGADGSFSQIALVGANILGYSHSGLLPASIHCYRVQAFNSYGDSGYSNEAGAITAGVDYFVSNPSFPISGLVNDVFNGSFTITNSGTTAGSQSITWRVYRSQDSVVDAWDVQVDTGTVPAIGSGVTSSIIDFSGTWPGTAGSYYLIIVTSATDDGNPGNNNAISVVINVATPFIDYLISTVSFPTSGVVNAAFSGSFMGTNAGNVAGSQNITWNVYRSNDNIYDSGDIQVDTGTLSALGAGSTSTSISFAGSWPSNAGTYFLIIGISATDDSNGNNNKVVSNPISVSESIILSVSLTSLDFGAVIKYQSLDKTVTIYNDVTSSSNLTGSVSISGSANYSIFSGSGAYNLAPGSSRTVTVRFSPSSTGIKTGSLSITHNATNALSPIPISLTGTGMDYIEISVSPTSLDFGSVTVVQSLDKTVSFSNSSSSTANLTGIVTISGTHYSIISGGGSYDLSPGYPRTVTVRFSPSGVSSLGTQSGSLSISHNGTNASSPITVPLTGIGDPIIWSYYTDRDTSVVEGSTPAEASQFGSGQSLWVGLMVTNRARALIRFPVANAIPSGATVVEANLRLYETGYRNTPFNLRIGWVTSDSWSESTGWGDQPVASAYTSRYFNAPSTVGYIYFDVISEVQRMVNDRLNGGLMIWPDSEYADQFLFFDSRETPYGSTRRPLLIVKYAP
jgi:hypothetical protein